jgi:hypothetical protein
VKKIFGNHGLLEDGLPLGTHKAMIKKKNNRYKISLQEVEEFAPAFGQFMKKLS